MAVNNGKVRDPSQVIPGRPVDWQLGNQNATDRRTYRALQNLIETKVEGSSNLGSANVGELLVFTATGWEGQDKRSYLSLDDLTDVSVSAPTTDHILKHNGSVFVNVSIIDLLTLDQLAGVVAPTPSLNDVLTYNGTNWVPAATATSDLDSLSDVTISAPSDGDFLVYNGGTLQWGNRTWTPAAFGVGAAPTLAKLEVNTPDAGTRGFVVRGVTAQTADLIQARDVSDNLVLTLGPTGPVTLLDAVDFVFGTTTGTRIGTVGGAAGQKIGAFGATPIVQPLLATGAGATVDNVISALQALGWVRQT